MTVRCPKCKRMLTGLNLSEVESDCAWGEMCAIQRLNLQDINSMRQAAPPPKAPDKARVDFPEPLEVVIFSPKHHRRLPSCYDKSSKK